MADFFPERSSCPDEQKYRIRILGVNNAHPTKQLGVGVAITRTGEGAYLITWAKPPGTFLGWTCDLGAATPGDLAGYSAVRDTYDSTAGVYTLPFVVYNSSFAAADLIADQYADITVTFSTNGEAG